jgi:hypothetical protein
MNLKDYIDNDLPLAGYPNFRTGQLKRFYPRKPRSCHNCEFVMIDEFSLEKEGCSTGFNTKIDGEKMKPLEKCYPVKDNNTMSDLHADAVGIKIEELR